MYLRVLYTLPFSIHELRGTPNKCEMTTVLLVRVLWVDGVERGCHGSH